MSRFRLKGIPVIPVRGGIVFPGQTIPLRFYREFARRAFEVARETDSREPIVLLAIQRDPDQEIPRKTADFYPYGVMAIGALSIRDEDEVVIHTEERVRFRKIWMDEEGILRANATFKPLTGKDLLPTPHLHKHIQELMGALAQLDERLAGLAEDIQNTDPDQALNVVFLLGTFYPTWDISKRARLLGASSLEEAQRLVIQWLEEELGRMELRARIYERVQERMERQQKEFYLQQQLQEIQKELGLTEEEEFAKLEERIHSAGMPQEVEAKALEELRRLQRIPPMSPESGVIRSYLDWLVSLPWSKRAEDHLDLSHVKKVLDEDHYGLEKPKTRILEYLASTKLKGEVRGQVICFVGPPGVGKTSLAQSIARALGRPFVRMSLGGIRDEAEIRGHRRTYIGALPGRIIQMIRRARVKNPLMLLDEIDKLGRDWRGDPYAALMEVLDPELNSQFQDHYLEVDFDLSEVLFITTANNPYAIPRPLYDRMEVIPIRGYLDDEKFFIARNHLIPKKRAEVGLPEGSIHLTDGAIRRMIHGYTREAGVRDLERKIRRLFLKVARTYVERPERIRITQRNLPNYLGVPPFEEIRPDRELPPGVAYALAWSETGGEMLRMEVLLYPGKGKLILTGSLGDVMKESAQIAFSIVQRQLFQQIPNPDIVDSTTIHIHVPEGAIPKDGPSAGLPILIALFSALTGKPVPGTFAFTGEITLTGKILPVGGLPEKLMAARRNGIRTVVLPEANRLALNEIPEPIQKGIEIRFARRVEDVIRDVLGSLSVEPMSFPWMVTGLHPHKGDPEKAMVKTPHPKGRRVDAT